MRGMLRCLTVGRLCRTGWWRGTRCASCLLSATWSACTASIALPSCSSNRSGLATRLFLCVDCVPQRIRGRHATGAATLGRRATAGVAGPDSATEVELHCLQRRPMAGVLSGSLKSIGKPAHGYRADSACGPCALAVELSRPRTEQGCRTWARGGLEQGMASAAPGRDQV
jgi:hypothetical protein